ncbi:uncharacterized protein LOC120678465 isoform X3 [Panicum virgatum]|uniref:uncharacterized protein LOC120678465 isoform X3 n=1 Tax=Panicum virgatum TaxID=38727 RepID=UPI0019D5DCCA|nr:uncharacterized protein LOC120678465 isoform X3 [Panicum virgatum]
MQINYTASSVNRVLECPESSDADSNLTVFTVKHTNAEYIQRYKRPEFEVKRINNGEKYTCGATKGLSTTKKGSAHGGATKITPHCSKCRSAGHDKRKCPFEGNTKDRSSGTIGKGKKKQVIICCNLCALTGHNDGECMASCSQCGLMGHNEDECLV